MPLAFMRDILNVNLALIAKEMHPRSMAARDWVFQVLRAAIVRGVLPGGMPLKQDEISLALNVSHIPVREAFRQLEAQGLVRIYPNRGAVVTELSPEEIHDIIEVRAILEMGALHRAITYMTDDTIKTARAILDEAIKVSEPNKLEELNLLFHFTLYEPANNKSLYNLIDQMHANLDRYIRPYYSESLYYEESKRQHAELLAACEARDKKTACRLLREHIYITKPILQLQTK